MQHLHRREVQWGDQGRACAVAEMRSEGRVRIEYPQVVSSSGLLRYAT